jgi:hypothetical protein
LNQIIVPAITPATRRTGATTRRRSTPLAFSAMISFSLAIVEKVYSTATSTDIGSVSATLAGRERRKNSPTSGRGRPFPARFAISFAIVLIRITPVNAKNAKSMGPRWARSR